MHAKQTFNVTFGDCDPVGIVFYPTIFRWMDATFHSCLKTAGGHQEICRRLECLGLGVISSHADFQRPLADGDELEVCLNITGWSTKSASIEYIGQVGDSIVFVGKEIRGMFVKGEQGLSLKEIAPLRRELERFDQ